MKNIDSTINDEIVSFDCVDVNALYFNLLNEHKKAIDLSTIVSKCDTFGVITYVNDQFCAVSGYNSAELVGKKHSIVNHPDMPKAIFTDLWKSITSGIPWKGIIKNKRKDGSHYFVDTTVCPIKDSNEKIVEFIAIRHDITEIYAKEKLIRLQNTDITTHLYNLTKLQFDLDRKKYRHLAILHIPELRKIESAYGVAAFHQVLRQVSKFLTAYFDGEQVLYRKDEISFVVATPIDNCQQFISQCDTCIAEFENTTHITAIDEFSLSLYVGVAKGNDGLSALNHCQLALSSGLESHTRLTHFNDASAIKESLMLSIDWSQKLKAAITNNSIIAYGQRIVDKSGETYSTEVLMRYVDPLTKEHISPFIFLKYAEEANVYKKISLLLIEQAFEHFSITKQRFSINLTISDFENEVQRSKLIELINRHNIGEQLTIELVESTNFQSLKDILLDFLFELKNMKVTIAIDDFGSGYSNFNNLTLMPIDILKIDGSLIRNITSDAKKHLMVKSIIEFSHSLGLKVVAEFVENQEIFKLLQALKVDYYQGYYFDRPSLLERH